MKNQNKKQLNDLIGMIDTTPKLIRTFIAVMFFGTIISFAAGDLYVFVLNLLLSSL